MGAPVPDEMQQIQGGIQKASQQFNSQSAQQSPQSIPPPSTQSIQQTKPVTEEQTAESLTPYKVDLSSQQTPPTPQRAITTTIQNQQNNLWAMITIIASVGAASAIGGSLFVVRHTRKVTN